MKIDSLAMLLAIDWRFLLPVVWMTAVLAPTQQLAADGWHNASLSTASLDEWMNDIKTQVPQVSSRIDKSSLKSGQGPEELQRLAEEAAQRGAPPKAGAPPQAGQLNANFTPEQVALLGRKANDCLEIMAFMDNRNIFPREFPRFQLSQIPNYRKNAKALLSAMGPVGSKSVVEMVRSHLMGNAPPGGAGLELHNDYLQDLIDVLKQSAAQGDLTAEDFQTLRDASQGQKPPALAALASKLDDVFASVPIPSLLEWLELAPDARTKAALSDYLTARVASASQAELMAALNHEGLSTKARVALCRSASNHLAMSGRLLRTRRRCQCGFRGVPRTSA